MPADLTAALQTAFPSLTVRPSADWPSFAVPASDVTGLLRTLRDAHGYDMLADLTAVDWDRRTPRFTVVYHLLSTTGGGCVRVTADCPDDHAPAMPSACTLWEGANWHERECYDMFGITFTGHPDLRRILMWEGYPHHPLRKDFPLAGVEAELHDPEIAAATGVKVRPAPMAGGPFTATPGLPATEAEPRAMDQSWNERRGKPGA